ncbi:MAG: adenylate kinase family protein [Anaerolineae bacterium]
MIESRSFPAKPLEENREHFRAILLFGPPGSGKGTLGKFLSSAGNHYHLSSGDIFRGLSPDSPMGKLYYTYASKGHLVPDEITIEIWRSYVGGLIATNRYFPKKQFLLLDGIPRTPKQADMLDAYVEVSHVILLDVETPEVLIKRIQGRAKLEKRQDDADQEVLRTRMQVYQRETFKLLERYPSQLVSRFNADQRPLEVLRDVLQELSHLLSAF